MSEITYRCASCDAALNLSSSNLYPSGTYFEAGNKGTLSFFAADETKFRQEIESKIWPFFETLDFWGIQRKRTKLLCISCGALLGHIYYDGPTVNNSRGQYNFGPSQVSPRYIRYRIKAKSVLPSQFH